VQNKKIRTIVGYKCVVLGTDCGHELPIFRTTEPEIIDVIRQVTHRVRYFDQRCVQAFIDQELHCHPATARPCRVARKSTAGTLDQTAAKLHSGGNQLSGAAHAVADQISGVAHGTADKFQAAADYIRQTDLKGMGEDLKDIVKRYPGPALAAAAVLGFIVARGFRRD
jgi:TolA-binding protein